MKGDLTERKATAFAPLTIGLASNRHGFGRNAMICKVGAALAGLFIMGSIAHADDIEGNWRTQSGDTAAIGNCGGGYCITLKTGKFAGRRIGNMAAAGDGAYAGEITDPASDKTYSGKATVSGRSMKMSGCVLGGLICKSQTWNKM